MAQSSERPKSDKSGEPKKRFGTGRSFEEVLNEVYRHAACLTRDLERVQSYLEGISRKRDNMA